MNTYKHYNQETQEQTLKKWNLKSAIDKELWLVETTILMKM